ncbi:hypothetical protein [Streptomyces scopuliridis]|uniref:hypothetical protein n=1 Tax=Streptomyces scopuliridis TaxID=452529 RepID=UPI00341E483F
MHGEGGLFDVQPAGKQALRPRDAVPVGKTSKTLLVAPEGDQLAVTKLDPSSARSSTSSPRT